MRDLDELSAWLRLTETPGIGRASARRLLAAFGAPQAVFAAPPKAWLEWLTPVQADALARPSAELTALIQRSGDWLGTTEGPPRALVTLGDPAYPRLLLEAADPPLLLYALGQTGLLNAPGIAVVGSRNPTPQGLENARSFAAALSDHGLAVVSGLALGIDGAAHEGALTGPGSTVAVVGTGLDRVYPKRHLALARRIAEQGLLVSEYPLGTPPVAVNFPRRNRLIAGMTRGTLVIEAALPSGSLITARLAVENGREVFAIPGSIHSPQSKGCHALIKEGARLVEAASDVLEELRLGGPAARSVGSAGATRQAASPTADTATAAASGDPLLDVLGFEPVTLDALSERLGEAPAALSARLLELELAGEVVRRPGQLFQRLVRA
jgi:DNA processing protein